MATSGAGVNARQQGRESLASRALARMTGAVVAACALVFAAVAPAYA